MRNKTFPTENNSTCWIHQPYKIINECHPCSGKFTGPQERSTHSGTYSGLLTCLLYGQPAQLFSSVLYTHACCYAVWTSCGMHVCLIWRLPYWNVVSMRQLLLWIYFRQSPFSFCVEINLVKVSSKVLKINIKHHKTLWIKNKLIFVYVMIVLFQFHTIFIYLSI